MVDSRSRFLVALAVVFASRSGQAQDGPNLIQYPRVVPVLWNGPGGRTARDNTDFLSKFILTVGWMGPEWSVNRGSVHTAATGGGWVITPVDASTDKRSRTDGRCPVSGWLQSTNSSLCDADIVGELEYQLTHAALPYDLSSCDQQSPPVCNTNYIYVVQLPIGVTEVAFNSSTGVAPAMLCDPVVSNSTYCGYHDRFTTTIGGVLAAVRYIVVRDFYDPDCTEHGAPANVPCASSATCASQNFTEPLMRCDKSATIDSTCDAELRKCVWNVTPGTSAKNASILLSHEVGETLTDPDVVAGEGYREIGDVCKVPLESPGQMGNTGYTIQKLSRYDGSCYLQCSDNASQCSDWINCSGTGCLDSSSQCQPGNTTSACGSQGLACAAHCSGGQICSSGQCITPCGRSSCGGCCDAQNTCQPGTSQTACGGGGGSCQNCAAFSEWCMVGSNPPFCDFP